MRSVAVWLTGMVICVALEFWALTWRRDDRALKKLDRLIAAGDRIAAVCWHGKYFPLFALVRGRQLTVLTMESFRGEVIAVICRWFGYQPIILPLHSAGRTLDLLKSALDARTPLLAIALDGPLGPRQSVKPGFVVLASALKLRILPITVHSRPVRIAKRRWDRRETPLPFAQITVAVGDPIDVPEHLNPADFDEWRSRIARALNTL